MRRAQRSRGHRGSSLLSAATLACAMVWTSATPSMARLAPEFQIERAPEALVHHMRTIGTELPVTAPQLAPAAGGQVGPAVATDGSGFLMVWEDQRAGSLESDIYATRLAPDGVVLDPTGIPVSTAAFGQGEPAVAWDGRTYVVVWSDTRSDGQSYDVFAARVTRAGRVMDHDGVPVSTAAFAQARPAVASDGDGVSLVVWEDDRDGDFQNDVMGARLSAGGVLDPDGLPVSMERGDQLSPSVSWGDKVFLVGWTDDRDRDFSFDVHAARLSPGGDLLDRPPVVVSAAAGDQSSVEVAWGVGSFMLAWTELDPDDFSADVRAARVSIGGHLLDPGSVGVATGLGDQFSPSLSSGPAWFLAVWTHFDPRTGRSEVTGSVLAATGRPWGDRIDLTRAAGARSTADAAGAPGGFLVAWEDQRSGTGTDVFATRVEPKGEVLDPAGILASRSAAQQQGPALASNGELYLAVWQEQGDRGFDIRAARVAPGGRVLDPEGITVAAAPGDQAAPAVAWMGEEFLVVWEDTRSATSFDVYGARVTTDGDVVDPAGIPVASGPGSEYGPDVAAGPDGALVVWEDTRGGEFTDLYAGRVSHDGDVLDPEGILLTGAPADQRAPAVAWNGSSFLAAWEDGRLDDFTDLFAARVDPEGLVLDPEGIDVSSAPFLQISADVDCVRSMCMVAWADTRTQLFAFDVYAARVTAGGAVLDPGGIAVATGPTDERGPAVTRGEPGFALAWSVRRTGGVDLAISLLGLDGGRSAGPGGLSGGRLDEGAPAMAGAARGRLLAAYERFEPDGGFRAIRLFARPVLTG